jgi:hypothetical protein
MARRRTGSDQARTARLSASDIPTASAAGATNPFPVASLPLASMTESRNPPTGETTGIVP